MDAVLDWLQWPAMVVTVAAAWLVGSQSKRRRSIAFWTFLVSNLLWIAWGFAAHAYALIALQFFLAALNIRGALKNEPTQDSAQYASIQPPANTIQIPPGGGIKPKEWT